MKVSFIVGVCVKYDAISSAVRNEIKWMEAQPHWDLKLFTFACEYSDLPHQVVNSSSDIILDEHFQNSDILIFHYGVFSELINCLFFAPTKARKTAIFHNITPAEYVPNRSRELIQKSFNQLASFQLLDSVICDSEENSRVLRENGIYLPTAVLPLPGPSTLSAPTRKPSCNDGIVRIANVGRFVSSKGPLDLLGATARLVDELPNRQIALSMIGKSDFSDPDMLSQVSSTSMELSIKYSNLNVEIVIDADEGRKAQILNSADIFCLPSYHEGYCVPVLEALSSGCKVITYDNSNLINVAGGLSALVETGNVGSLQQALVLAVQEVQSEGWVFGDNYERHLGASKDYLAYLSPDRAKARFLSHISSLLQTS